MRYHRCCANIVYEQAACIIISRPIAKGSKVDLNTGIISHATAPKAVDAKTYLVHVFNLGNPDAPKTVADEHDLYEERQTAFRDGPPGQEERGYDILCSYEIDPPDPQIPSIRETLNSLRTSGYEIIRVCVLSGGKRYPKHFTVILRAFCTYFRFMETLHLLELNSRVLFPLVSFYVVSADPSILEHAARSDVSKLLQQVKELLEISIKGVQVSSELSALHISLDFVTSWLRRATVNLLTGNNPSLRRKKDSAEAQNEVYVSLQLQVPVLRDSFSALWITA
ncbi:unnamed protein product [Agarophyton chilense]